MEHASSVAGVVWEIFSLLLVALAIYAFSRKSKLPFTVLLVLVGIALNEFREFWPGTLTILDAVTISPDLILYVFLPSLIFESSFNLNAGELRHNLLPILTLAVPGLLISTGIIGAVVWWVTAISLPAALLLGAILSATDPVAVISLFRQTGAPERLTTLIEGESLFNDATSVVLSKILLGVIAAGIIGQNNLITGATDFVVLFSGGLAVGVVLGYITGKIIGWVVEEPYIEIGLTTALAYLSFLVAEEVFHVSGIMSTVGAGLTLGSWGRIRISSSVRVYMEHFWGLLVFIANALLFLLVGLTVNLGDLVNAWDLLAWVVFAMLLSRAAVIFGIIPLIGRMPGSQPIGKAYRFIMFWGGLRGAVALAIVLSLPSFEQSELFVALVMGAVLFTLLVQGLTIEPLIQHLGLDRLPLADQIAFLERDLVAMRQALERLPQLEQGGVFSRRIAGDLRLACHKRIQSGRQALDDLRQHGMDIQQETNLLFLNALSEERAIYLEMYAGGHLSEAALRELLLILRLQIDAMRYNGTFRHIHSHRVHRALERFFYRLTETAGWLRPVAERMRLSRLIRDYEQVWGHYLGSGLVLSRLEETSRLDSTPPEVIQQVREQYRKWQRISAEKLHLVGEFFPEFVRLMQQRFGQRIILLAERDATELYARHGIIPNGMAETVTSEISAKIAQLRGQPMQKVVDDPKVLLRKVPLFSQLDSESLEQIARHCEAMTLDAREYLVHEGRQGLSLYLITRGVVRFYHEADGERHELGTLMAGEFFGESALMGDSVTNLSVVTVTPCRVYVLTKGHLDTLLRHNKALQEALTRRNEELRQIHASAKQSKYPGTAMVKRDGRFGDLE